MTSLGGDFDATRIEPAQPFEVLPAGRYLVHLTDSDKRLTKDGKGEYLWLDFEILDGPHAGRHLFDRLNLWNANQQAKEIAERAMSALCHATGKLHVGDSIELHHLPLIATVRVRPAQEASAENGWKSFDASNEIRGYSAAGGAQRQAAPGDLSRPTPVVPNPPPAAPWNANKRRP